MSADSTRNVLILGAGVYQVPLIQRARALGLKTVVLSIPGPYPGVELADTFLPINTTDVDAVVKAAVERDVSAVVTTGTDVCVPALGAVVDRLGLPGPNYESALRSMDKVRMKIAMRDAGVPTADFAIAETLDDATAAARRLGYPVMVKAVDSSGSRGITKVDGDSGMEAAWASARAVTRSPQVLVEQFLAGIEFGAQAFVVEDRVCAVMCHNDTVTPGPFLTPIGHSMPAHLPDGAESAAAEATERAIAALGARDVVSNVDLLLVDGEPFIIEIGARMGATCLPENVSIYGGFDVYDYVLRLALGERSPVTVTDRQANAALLLQSRQTGTMSGIDVPDDVRSDPRIWDLSFDARPGDAVRNFVVGPDRVGHIITTGTSADEAERACVELADRIRFDVTEDAAT